MTQKYRHDPGPEPTNGGLYACSCGMRHMSLEQAEEHKRLVAPVRETKP